MKTWIDQNWFICPHLIKNVSRQINSDIDTIGFYLNLHFLEHKNSTACDQKVGSWWFSISGWFMLKGNYLVNRQVRFKNIQSYSLPDCVVCF